MSLKKTLLGLAAGMGVISGGNAFAETPADTAEAAPFISERVAPAPVSFEDTMGGIKGELVECFAGAAKKFGPPGTDLHLEVKEDGVNIRMQRVMTAEPDLEEIELAKELGEPIPNFVKTGPVSLSAFMTPDQTILRYDDTTDDKIQGSGAAVINNNTLKADYRDLSGSTYNADAKQQAFDSVVKTLKDVRKKCGPTKM